MSVAVGTKQLLSRFFRRAKMAARTIRLMSKRPDDLARERKRLDAVAAGEARIHERLLTLRGELDGLARAIDRITMPPSRPGMMPGGGALFSSILPFPRRLRRR